MAGNEKGAKKAHQTTIERHGVEFVEQRGRLGGRKSRGGGFTGNPELASQAAKKSWERRRANKSSKA